MGVELSKRVPLVDRIRAALDEEEAVARLLPQGGLHWNVVLTGSPPWGVESDREFVEHILRHDPARVLRQVAAMRKIVEEHEIECQGESYQYCRSCHDYQNHQALSAPCPTILALAEAYGIEP